MTHRGSGRGPNTIEHASHLSAADLATAVAIRRDRLVSRQRVPYQADPRRQDEIDTLGDIHRLLVGFEVRRLARPEPPADITPDELFIEQRIAEALYADRRRPKGRDIGT